MHKYPPFCLPWAIDHELPEDGADRGDLRLIASRSRASQAYRVGGRSSHCPGSIRPGGSGQRCGSGVVAMTVGKDRTFIGLSAWLVAVWIGVTMPGLLGAEPKTT